MTGKTGAVPKPAERQFSFRRLCGRVGIAVALLYLAAVALLCVSQRKLMYFPLGENPRVLATLAHKEGFTAWTNTQGAFMGWVRPSRQNPGASSVLVFHGNAGSALDRTFLADILQREHSQDVYLVEYPGYGGRDGSPSQETLFAAAREAFDNLHKKGKIYLIGESLGTGVASYLAGTCSTNVAGLFLIAPFNNFAAAASSHYPIFPTSLILKDTYHSDVFLKSYTGPLGVILAGRDEVVPNHLGRKLFDGYSGPKKLWLNETATHNTVSDLTQATCQEVLAFLSTGK